MSKKNVGQKNFLVKKFFDPKILVKKMLGQNFCSTKILEPKIFWVKKKNLVKKILEPKKLLG